MKMLKSPFRRFRKDNDGLISFEFLILVPLFLFMIFTTYSLYNMFHKKTLTVKAAATVSDLISRQVAVDDQFVDNMHKIFREVAAVREDEITWIRVTSVINRAGSDDDDPVIEVRWSEVRGATQPELQNNDAILADAIPELFALESVMLVETSRTASQIFSNMPLTSVGDVTFENRFTAPLRFSPRLINLDNPQDDDPVLTEVAGS